MRRGFDQEASAGNSDAIANTGFVVGRDAVAVFDPGGSLADGERLRRSIRAVTSLPIRFVVLTHVHPDHVFGAGAFLPDQPAFVGHARLPAALDARGAYYQRSLGEALGGEAAGPVVRPTLLVEQHAELDLGGRVLRLQAHRPAHTDADLSAFDVQTGTLLAGDLLFSRRAPALDGDLKGWIAELAALRAHPAARAVPGHGPLALPWPSGADALAGYLDVLLVQTRAAIRDGVPIEDASRTVAASERDKWLLFDAYNGRNVLEAYKELEWE